MDTPVIMNFEETVVVPTTVLNFGARNISPEPSGTISFTELSNHIRQAADSNNAPCSQFILSVILGKFKSGDYDTLLDNKVVVV